MENRLANSDEARPRLLMTAYHYDRWYSMESRLSWHRARCASREYDVTVLSARGEKGESRHSESGNIELAVLPLNRVERTLMRIPGAFYLGYRLWHRRVFELAKELHRQRPFALVHHVSFCGYREPSDCWKLPVPFVWGPIGGTHRCPVRFLGQLGLVGAFRELIRGLANACQLRFDRRVRRAMFDAAEVLAANREVAADLRKHFGISPRVQLETGVARDARPARDRREVGEPLRILWAGRLQPWKGLPLLLRALATLPAESSYTLRVLGTGPERARWQRLARRLGVDGNVEWVGWPDYPAQLPHYQWADAFAFTSLRDTSGTGLLEALAAGAPIVGLNHQGAADIMTRHCGVAVDPSTPRSAIAGFRAAIEGLINDRDRLQLLSRGATERAEQYCWERQWGIMQSIYASARRDIPAPAICSTIDTPCNAADRLIEVLS